LHQGQFAQFTSGFQLGQWQHAREGFDELHVDGTPRVLLVTGLGVEVVAGGVQGGWVGVGGADDAGNPGDARFGTAGVVKEELIARLHAAQEVARLVITHPIPARATEAPQVMDRQFVGFGFHQPFRHELCSCLPVFDGVVQIVLAIDSYKVPAVVRSKVLRREQKASLAPRMTNKNTTTGQSMQCAWKGGGNQ
jgi:hypothetical protein